MVSEANQKQIEAAGLSFILGAKIPYVPYLVAQWRREHPGEEIPDGQVFTQPWPAGPDGGRRDQVIYYQYKADRARRTLRGIDEQVEESRAGRRREDPGETQPVHPAVRRHPHGQPGPGRQGQGPGRAEGLRHQPGGLPRRHPGHRRSS